LDSYRAGDTSRALAMFTQITADNPGMSDAWLGRMACGDHALDTVAHAHQYCVSVRFVEQTREEARQQMLRVMPEPVVETTLDALGTPTPAEQRISPDV
jgi:hypothetical protein